MPQAERSTLLRIRGAATKGMERLRQPQQRPEQMVPVELRRPILVAATKSRLSTKPVGSPARRVTWALPLFASGDSLRTQHVDTAWPRATMIGQVDSQHPYAMTPGRILCRRQSGPFDQGLFIGGTAIRPFAARDRR